jgi:hypothetical protein
MRNATETESVEMLLGALFEGTASDGPWVEHNGAAWEMEELAYHEQMDIIVPYQYLLLTLASDETRAVTRQAAQAVRDAADRSLALLDTYERAVAGEHPEWAKFIPLLETPFPVKIPPNCDTRDPDVIAVMMRDIRFEGSWEHQMQTLSPPRNRPASPPVAASPGRPSDGRSSRSRPRRPAAPPRPGPRPASAVWP